MDAFLQNFYKVFPHLSSNDFYVTGESYAGMFVPSVARYIHLQNKQALEGHRKLREKKAAEKAKAAKQRQEDDDDDEDDVNNQDASSLASDRIIVQLKGASLGNGWIDAQIQGPAVIDYSWWHGLIDKPTRDSLHVAWDNCRLIQSGEAPKHYINATLSPPFHPFSVQDDCGLMWGVLQGSGYPNAYDVTTWDPNVDQVTFASEVFYNNPLVKKALHAPDDIVWHGCRQGGGRRRLGESHADGHRRLYMDNEQPLSVVPYIADLVDDGIPVIVYNGDRDMTTNMVGTELALNEMKWKGSGEPWLNAPRGLWMVDGHQAGWSKEYGNLTFVTVYNSGHMVPYNVPEPAHDLLNRLLKHKSFIDLELPQVRVQPFQRAAPPASKHSSKKTPSIHSHDHHHDDDDHSDDDGYHFHRHDSFRYSTKTAPVEGLSVRADALNSNANLASGNHWQMAGVSAVSMLAGFLLALVAIRRTNKGYHQVPDAAFE
jgi:hypothetical protein